ncbi:hypothetical protein ACFZBU_41345 [Embleya sp. NPDC008237]|uniref:hypothetical protein n=1 Tax=Embleya sp. NPDC008237 TaxID=3363978 RepID=UPI0036EC79CC
MMVLVLAWAVLVSWDRAVRHGPARETRRGAIGSAALKATAIAAAAVLAPAPMIRLWRSMGCPWLGPTDERIEREMSSVHERMTLSLVHAAAALLMLIVVTLTTRRRERY